jgi:hypothetical protein
MSFLDLNVNDVPDLTVLPEGEEYELRILECEIKTSSKGNQGIQCRFDCPAEPNSKDITHWIGIPDASADEKKRNAALRRIRDFCICFGINTVGGIDLSDVQGRTGWAILAIENDDTYGEQNKIKRFITGH